MSQPSRSRSLPRSLPLVKCREIDSNSGRCIQYVPLMCEPLYCIILAERAICTVWSLIAAHGALSVGLILCEYVFDVFKRDMYVFLFLYACVSPGTFSIFPFRQNDFTIQKYPFERRNDNDFVHVAFGEILIVDDLYFRLNIMELILCLSIE